MLQNNQQKTAATTFPIATCRTKELIWTTGFAAAAVIFPALFAHTPHNQWITGTIVNAILFLAVWQVGIVNAALVAALPSSIALARGLLPAPMAVLIPWIIVSNFILIVTFYSLKKPPLAGVIIASSFKFLFLFVVATYFIKIASPLLAMMQWPQLVTALAGGLITIGFIKFSAPKNIS
jgi:hypothetical protein